MDLVVVFKSSSVDIVKDMPTTFFETPKAKYIMDNEICMIYRMNLEIVSDEIKTKEQHQTMNTLGIVIRNRKWFLFLCTN